MSKSTHQESEWQTLYAAVRKTCAKYGHEDPYGRGDFWVVDDSWGGVAQKVVVTSTRFLNPRLSKELATCIRDTKLLGADIVVSLDLGQDSKKLSRPMGLIIGASGALEEWDLRELRQLFGQDFYT